MTAVLCTVRTFPLFSRTLTFVHIKSLWNLQNKIKFICVVTQIVDEQHFFFQSTNIYVHNFCIINVPIWAKFHEHNNTCKINIVINSYSNKYLIVDGKVEVFWPVPEAKAVLSAGQWNPFIEISMGANPVKTLVKRKTTNAKWDRHQLQITSWEMPNILILHVFSRTKGATDVDLGYISISSFTKAYIYMFVTLWKVWMLSNDGSVRLKDGTLRTCVSVWLCTQKLCSVDQWPQRWWTSCTDMPTPTSGTNKRTIKVCS